MDKSRGPNRLLDKLDDPQLRTRSGKRTVENGGSREILAYQIEGRLHLRQTIAEYTVRDTTAPIQISEYRIQPRPEPYRNALLSVERLADHLRQLPMPATRGE